MMIADFVGFRTVGGLAGAFLGIVIVWPESVRGFLQRFAVSIVSAWIFAPTVRWYFDWPAEPDSIIAAACLTGCFFWWAAHTVIRLLQAGWLPVLGRWQNGSGRK